MQGSYPDFFEDAVVPEGTPKSEFRVAAAESIRTEGNNEFKKGQSMCGEGISAFAAFRDVQFFVECPFRDNWRAN